MAPECTISVEVSQDGFLSARFPGILLEVSRMLRYALQSTPSSIKDVSREHFHALTGNKFPFLCLD